MKVRKWGPQPGPAEEIVRRHPHSLAPAWPIPHPRVRWSAEKPSTSCDADLIVAAARPSKVRNKDIIAIGRQERGAYITRSAGVRRAAAVRSVGVMGDKRNLCLSDRACVCVSAKTAWDCRLSRLALRPLERDLERIVNEVKGVKPACVLEHTANRRHDRVE